MQYSLAADGRERADRPGTILLKRAMKLRGGTVDDFARQVLGRSRVSIWRWLRKATPIPQAVRDRLKAYCAEQRNHSIKPEDSNGR